MATFFRNTGILWTTVALAALFGGCTGRGKGPLLLHPLPPAAEGYTLSDGALRYEAPGLRVTARPVDSRLVEKEYRESGKVSPFGPEEGAFSPFIIFSLLLENTSGKKIDFSTYRVILLSRRPNLVVPLDISDIYLMGRESPDIRERALSFQETCFNGPISVDKDTSVERYLVFPTPEGKSKTLTLALDDLYLGLESYDLEFVFETFPVEEQEGKKKKE